MEYNSSKWIVVDTTGTLKDIQLEVCQIYNSNIIIPIILAFGLLIFRWIIIYRLDKESRLYSVLEFGTDMLIAMLLLVSILWWFI